MPKAEPLPESDEKRFANQDAFSRNVAFGDAVDMIRKQFLLCKKLGLPPTSDKWSRWSALVIRSWIARVQERIPLDDPTKCKAIVVYWWIKGATLLHLSSNDKLSHPKKIKGMNKDAEILEGFLSWNKRLNDGQVRWIEGSYDALVPAIKRQILFTIPATLNPPESTLPQPIEIIETEKKP
jgi:hypothetical protein